MALLASKNEAVSNMVNKELNIDSNGMNLETE
jgi:hypothetical protein